MATKIFDYNGVQVNPTTYSPTTSKKTDSVDEWFEGGNPVADNPDYKRSVYDDELLYSSEYQDPSAMRARNQGGFTKVGLSALRGAGKGAASALEYAGYLGDVQEWLGLDTDEIDVAYTNWLSEYAKSAKAGIDEAAPIYKRDPNAFWDNGDIAGSVATALDSTVDSAVGFGLLGLAVAATGGAALGTLATTAAGAALLQTSTALAMNYAESKQMATDAISNVKSILDAKLQSGEINELQHAIDLQMAAEEADKFIWRNKLNTWQDFLALRSLKNNIAGTRALVKESTKLGKAAVDVLGESFEEISSGALQNEAEYKAKERAGLDVSKYKKSAIDRALDYASSDQGIYEGVLGAIGGPIQSYAVNKPIERFVTKKSFKDRQERQAQQEEFSERNKAAILTTAAKQKEISDKMNAALSDGDVEAAAAYHAETFADLAFNNFKMGTTEKLEEHIDEILKDETVDPQIKEFTKQYKKDLATYEKEYVKIVNRRKDETASKKVDDIQRLTQHASIANEFKLFVLKSHNENQIASLNKDIAKIDSEIAQKGFLENETILSDTRRAMISKKSEIELIKGTLRENKNLTNEQRRVLVNKIDSLTTQVNDLRKIHKELGLENQELTPGIQNLINDKNEIIAKRLKYETANVSFENQIKDLRDNKLTPEIKAELRKAIVANESILAGKTVVSTEEIKRSAAEEAIQTATDENPNLTDEEKIEIASNTEAAQEEAIQKYNQSVLAQVNDIINNEALTPSQKIQALDKLNASVKNNYDLNPTQNDKQATSLKDYVLKHKSEQVDILNAKEGKDYIESTKEKESPKSEESKNALIRSFKLFTASVVASSTTSGNELLTAEQLSELLKNTPLSEINSKVTLVFKKFPKKKKTNAPKELGNGYYSADNEIRNIIEVVYEGKVIGNIYDPNRFFTLDNKTSKPVPIDFSKLSDDEIRKLYPEGDIKALRDAWSEAQALQDFISARATDKEQVLSNEELKALNFNVNTFFGNYDLYSSLAEWGELSSVPEALVKLPDGKETFVIYDFQAENTLSNFPSQVSELLAKVKDLKENDKFKGSFISSKLKGRYAILLQLGNGSYEWVPVAPKQADINELYSTISSTVLDAVKSGQKIDINQFPFRNLFIHTAGGKTKVNLRFAENGVIFTFEEKKGNQSKEVRVRIEEFKKIKNFQDLLNVVNKRIGNVTKDNSYIPVDNAGATIQLAVGDFRKSVIAGKEAGNVTESTDLSKDFIISVKPTIFKPVMNLDITTKIEAPKAIVQEQAPAFDPGNPFGQAIAEPDFDNAPEGVEVFTDEVAPKEDKPVNEKLAALKAKQQAKLDKIAKGKEHEGEGQMKVGDQLPSEAYNYSEAQSWLESRLPSSISVEDLNTVIDKLQVNGIPMGMLMSNVIYLSKTAERGTEYHEAFHAAFRLLSTDEEITSILNTAKKQFKAPSANDLAKLRDQAVQNSLLSEAELLDLYYEEKLADRFQDIVNGKTKAGWLTNLYTKIMNWLRFYTNNMDSIDAIFYKLDRGLYKNSSVKVNRFNKNEEFGVLKLLTKGVNENSNIKKAASSDLSNKIIYTAAAWIGNELQKDNSIKDFDAQFERFINMMSSKYSWDNEEQANYYLAMMENMDDDQVQALQDKIDEYYILYTDDSNKAIIYEQADKLLKVFKVDSTEEDEKEKMAEETSERFDVDFFTLGGFDSMTAPVKEFIGLTLYETTDEFGNKIQSGVDFIKVYNGLTAALAGAEDSEMIPRMMLFKKHNPQTEAVIQKLIDTVELKMSEDGKTFTYNEEKSNEYHVLMNAFKKEKVTFYTILHDRGTQENKQKQTRIIEANRKSSKQIQASNWAANFSADFIRLKADPDYKQEILSSINSALKIFELSKPLSEAELEKLASELKMHLSKLGITISQGFAEYSIAAYQVNAFPTYASDVIKSIYEPFANSISSDLIVSPAHLYEMKNALSRDENIYEKEITSIDDKTKKKKKSVGTFTRILKIAEGNTYFDENVLESTFTNAENQKVYSYLLRNQLMTKAKDFRSAEKRDQISFSEYVNGLNHLLNYEHASIIFSNYNVALIDGIRPTTLEVDQDIDTVKTQEGTTFGSMDSAQYLQSVLSFFADQKQLKVGEEGQVIKTAKYVFRQLEASNTGALVELPVLDYVNLTNDGSLQTNQLFKDTLANYIQQEWDRIAREYANFSNEARDIYSGYNDSLTKGRAFKFWAFPQLNGKFEKLAKTNPSSFDTNKDEMVRLMIDALKDEFKDFRELLKSEGVLENGELIIGNNLAYSNSDKWIADFFTNDYLNSMGINQMYDGDYSIGRKNFVDMVKRHKGSIGYGVDMGEGVTNIVTVEDPIKYVEKSSLQSFSELNSEDQKSIMANEIAMYKEMNPDASEDDIEAFVDSKVYAIQIADAQSYVTVEHVIEQLKRLGRYGKKVSDIYNKILEGKNINASEVKILEKSRAALNSRKTVIFDGNVYYKLSEIPLSPSLINTPGFEWHKNLLASMKASSVDQMVDQMVFKTASKAAQKNVVPFSEDGTFDFSKSVNPVQNKYKRLQVETPSGKEEITAGTQLINLIVAEQDPNLVVNYRGKDTTIGELRSIYYQLLADVRNVSFKFAATFLVDENGKKDPKKAAKKFAETVESSGGSELQIKYFTPDENGNPKYNWNIAPIIEKAEELFLAHFNKAYSVQKVEGSKVSLVSDVGVRINGESLKWGKKDESGKVWSECLMPRWISELYNLNEGDAIPTEVSEMLGYRIPTQDKHSMISLRVKGFLPNEYGSVIIVPKEVVLLSGADFDIDSLYISRYGAYKNSEKKLTRYGTATTVEGKYDEFVKYYTSDKNKDFKTMVRDFKLANAQEIKNRMRESGKKKHEVIEEFYPIFFKALGLPASFEEFAQVTNNGEKDINKGSLDNKILDAQMAMFNNDYIQNEIAKTPATLDSLKQLSKVIVKARQNAGTIVDSTKYNGFTIMGRYYAFVNNTEGKRNIGPTALSNVANAELTSHQIEYGYAPLLNDTTLENSDAKLLDLFNSGVYLYLYVNDKLITGYSNTLDTKGKRKADSLSTVLSAMTDNAKEALANLVNLGYDVIPLVNHAITQGIDLESAVMMVNTPDMITYAKLVKEAKRTASTAPDILDLVANVLNNIPKDLKVSDDEKVNIANPPLTKAERNLTTEQLKQLISINPTTYLNDVNVSRVDKLEYLKQRVVVLQSLAALENQQKYIMNFTSLQALYRGSNVSFDDNERFISAINLLQVYKYFKDPKLKALYNKGGALYRQTIDASMGTFDLDKVFANNPSLVTLAENFSKINGPISQEYFISRTSVFNRLVKPLEISISVKERYQIPKQLLTYLSSRVYKIKVALNPENFMHKLMLELGESESFGGLFRSKGVTTTGDELLEVKATLRSRGERNYLLDRLAVVEDGIGMVTIEFPSMSKFNNAESNKLTDAFLELYSNDSTRDFSKKLFLYLFFKDSFKFRNNTFINNITDFMFKDYSLALDDIQAEFSKENPDYSIFGFNSELELFNDFATVFLTDYNNKDIIRSVRDLEVLANNALKGVLTFKNVTYKNGTTGPALIVDKLAVRKYFGENSKPSKTVRYVLNTILNSNTEGVLSGIPGFIKETKGNTEAAYFNNISTKSIYRLVSDTEDSVIYAEMKQVGKKNLSPYAFSNKSLDSIANKVKAVRQENAENRRVLKYMKTREEVFNTSMDKVSEEQPSENEVIEPTLDPSIISAESVMPETGIFMTFVNDKPGPESVSDNYNEPENFPEDGDVFDDTENKLC